jgi:hypothetical protein
MKILVQIYTWREAQRTPTEGRRKESNVDPEKGSICKNGDVGEKLHK